MLHSAVIKAIVQRLITVRTEPTAAHTHASWRSGRAAGMQRRRRGSVRPEQPERTVTMSFSIGPTESQRPSRPPSSRATPRTLTDPSSARPQQDARGKERACGTAEHFSGEHRPAFKWWVRASERGLCWVRFHQAARTRTPQEYTVFLYRCNHGG